MIRFFFGLAILVPFFAQEHLLVPLADANRPVTLSIHLLHGSITVRGYSGREVIVDTKGGRPKDRDKEKTHEGCTGSRAEETTSPSNRRTIR